MDLLVTADLSGIACNNLPLTGEKILGRTKNQRELPQPDPASAHSKFIKNSIERKDFSKNWFTVSGSGNGEVLLTRHSSHRVVGAGKTSVGRGITRVYAWLNKGDANRFLQNRLAREYFIGTKALDHITSLYAQSGDAVLLNFESEASGHDSNPCDFSVPIEFFEHEKPLVRYVHYGQLMELILWSIENFEISNGHFSIVPFTNSDEVREDVQRYRIPETPLDNSIGGAEFSDQSQMSWDFDNLSRIIGDLSIAYIALEKHKRHALPFFRSRTLRRQMSELEFFIDKLALEAKKGSDEK